MEDRFDATLVCMNNWEGWEKYRNLDGHRVWAVAMNLQEGFFMNRVDGEPEVGRMGDFIVFDLLTGKRSIWSPTDFHNNHSPEKI